MQALRFAHAHKRAFVVIVLLAVGLGSLAALEPLVLKLIFDRMTLRDGGVRAIASSVAIFLGVLVLREVLGALHHVMTWRTRLGVQHELLSATVERLHTLPVTYHQQDGVGATMTRLERGVQGVVNGMSELAFNVLPALVYLALSLAIMIELSWKAALVVIAFIPLPAIIGALCAPEQTRREKVLFERWTRIYGRFQEVLAGIVTVKTVTMEEAEKQRFLCGVQDANAIAERGVRLDALTNGAKNLVVVLARIVAIVVGAWLVTEGELTAGTVVAFLGYVAGMFGPVQGLVAIYQTLQKTNVALKTVFSILEAQDALGDAPDARDVGRVRGEVRFANLHFSHDGRRDVLHGIDLHVRAGERIALVGPSGSGKSTLMALLQRIYDPSEGAVLLDGHDIRTLKQRALRRQIGAVLQDSLVLNDSVRHNIEYGTHGASEEDIVAAASAAHAHEFIRALPFGYDTMVGERGSLLSAGQRQRLLIARAMLRNPPVVILDDATSALDAETEAMVYDAMCRLVRGRTTFVVAHRLSTLASIDRVVVLSRGHITEVGTPRELLQRDGMYARMVRRHASGIRLTA